MGLLATLGVLLLGACSSFATRSPGAQSTPAPTVIPVFSVDNSAGEGPNTLPTDSELFSLPASSTTPGVSAEQASATSTVTPSPSVEATGGSTQVTISRYARVTLTPAPGSTGVAPAQETAPEVTPTPNAQSGSEELQASEDLLEGTSQYRLEYIYEDGLSPGWTTFDSWDVKYSLSDTDFVYRGNEAIAVSPLQDFAGFFIHLERRSDREILREDVAGFSFWINSGESEPAPYQLAATIVGSNEYPYWVEDDQSVDIDYEDSFFSETRLSLLDFNRQLQPGTWYQVIIWLENLPFDPDYQYITGFYIKNDTGFKETFYLDDISLIYFDD